MKSQMNFNSSAICLLRNYVSLWLLVLDMYIDLKSSRSSAKYILNHEYLHKCNFRMTISKLNRYKVLSVSITYQYGSIHIWRQMFWGYFWPTYHNQILYYISLFRNIRFSLTYLPKYLKIWHHIWMLPKTNSSFFVPKMLLS